jgi:protein TonB
MLRLRTTTTLSLLALAVGIGGTAWLSGQTAGWAGLPAHAARWPTWHHALAGRRSHAPWLAVHRTQPRAASAMQAQAATPPPPVELVPVAMPTPPVSYAAMRHHLAGQVLLHVQVDGAGRVIGASVARSSGDDVLDAHALSTVRGWRFAVPAGHAQGFSGDLPMRFTEGDARQLARAPCGSADFPDSRRRPWRGQGRRGSRQTLGAAVRCPGTGSHAGNRFA